MEEEMTESKRETYLDSIPYHCGLSVDVPSPRIITTWANGMYGCVSVWQDYTIHYQEYDQNSQTIKKGHGGYIGCGIIGFWLYYRTAIEDTGELFMKYFDSMYKKYYNEHKGDVDRWERDLRNETVNYCIKIEGKSSEYINTLYELISESDKMMILGHKLNFTSYLFNLLEHPKQPEDLNEALCVIAHKDEEIAELKEENARLREEMLHPNVELIKQLRAYFVDNSSDEIINTFIDSIRGAKDTQVTSFINNYIAERNMKDSFNKKDLHRILKSNQLYHACYSTFSEQVQTKTVQKK